jgi:hypothetical protein
MSGIGNVDPPGRSLVIQYLPPEFNPVARKSEKEVRVISLKEKTIKGKTTGTGY